MPLHRRLAWALGALIAAAPPGLRAQQPEAPPLTAAQLEQLITPFAGAPQDMLGIVLEAGRSPEAVRDAAAWAARPAASRGPIDPDWPGAVQLLAERAPRTLGYLAQDLQTTGALGHAGQTQPFDLWMAYGRVSNLIPAAAAPAPAPQAGTAPPPAAPYAAAAPPPAQAAPHAAAPPPAAASPYGGYPPPGYAAAPTYAAPPPATSSSSGSMAGAALLGGVAGLATGLLIADRNEEPAYWRGPYPYAGYRGYPVPPPAYRYGGAYGGAQALQADRMAYGSAAREDRQQQQLQLQSNRQGQQDELQQNRQQFRSEQSTDRQGAVEQRQSGRQATGEERQATRTESTANRQATRSEGATERQGQRQGAYEGRAPSWGPAQGMGGGLEAQRSRAPEGGFQRGGFERGGGGGRGFEGGFRR